MNPYANQINPMMVGQAVQQSFDNGIQRGREASAQNALAAYARNPDDPQAVEGVIATNPQYGLQIMEQKRAAEQKARLGQIAAAAAQGDPKAQAALWAEDLDLAIKLDDRQAKTAVEGFKFLGNAAYDIVQRPPEQQAQLWDQYIDRAVQMGFDGMAQYKGQYSPQLLNSFVAKVDGMKEFMGFQQPKYVPVGEGGLSGFQYGRPIMQGQQPQDFGPPAPQGVTFEPIDGGPTPQASGSFR